MALVGKRTAANCRHSIAYDNNTGGEAVGFRGILTN
jgi:hypothetical protein